MQNISFKSKIRAVDSDTFYLLTKKIGEKNFVKYPWTIKESVLSEKAYTKNVFDCTTCGITDGEKVLFMHLCPTRHENKNFNIISEFIESSIKNLNSKFGLQGFILGGQKTKDKLSENLLNNIISFLNKHNIPLSIFKFGDGLFHTAYFADKDEWLIASNQITSKMTQENSGEDILKKMFSEVKISEYDELA